MPRAILLVLNPFVSTAAYGMGPVHGVSIGGPDPCPQDWIPCRDQAEAIRLQAWIHGLACPACDEAIFEDPAPGAWYWKCTECELQIAPGDEISSSFQRAKGARMKATDALSSGMNAVYAAQSVERRLEERRSKW